MTVLRQAARRLMNPVALPEDPDTGEVPADRRLLAALIAVVILSAISIAMR